MRNGIIDSLSNYVQKAPLRMHMPGHKGKRVLLGLKPENKGVQGLLDGLRLLDVTEVSGLDNLHYPCGCIDKVQERAAKLFGSSRSFLLVNGATAGVHASLLATRMALGEGSVVVSRNAHRSVISALALSGMEPLFVWPKYDPDFGGYLPLEEKEVEKTLAEQEGFGPIKAVLATDPTYSGFSRDLKSMARLAHTKDAVLIVDEAHGTHFKFHQNRPFSSLDEGADLVVHGAHKTSCAFTQTGLLHVGKDAPGLFEGLIPAVEEALRVSQTTSPSYILMASLEVALDVLEEDGSAWVKRGAENGYELAARLSGISGISVAGFKAAMPTGLFKDPGKILVKVSTLGLDGSFAAEHLRKKERLEVEMATAEGVLLIVTGADTSADIDVAEASFRRLADRAPRYPKARKALFSTRRPVKKMPLRDAFFAISEEVGIQKATGRVSSDTVIVYPPGSPLIVPGEVFDQEIVDTILEAKKTGLNCLGRAIGGKDPEMKVFCVKS